MFNPIPEPLLAEHSFTVGKRRKRMTAKLGFPLYSVEKERWTCPFQIVGLKDGVVQLAYGDEALEAILNAVKTLRQWIDKMNEHIIDKQPYETIFPQMVPTVYGLDLHWLLCEVIDQEVRRRERSWSRKRSRD